ncbi:MAG TPA: ankyrin repeat domain-containing protein [Burkholderiaceae bacterium]|jgi:hypothetical protein|nr:ankyrin repeat domain-containing protein [Burkholderiaceae bacterium]
MKLKQFSWFIRPFRLGLAVCLAVAAVPVQAQKDAYQDFFEAVAIDDAGTVRTYLLRGIAPNSEDPVKGPAIVLAAQERAFKALRVLLESPLTNVNARNKAGETALMYAAGHGELEMARLLLKRGAQINSQGWTPLHYAASAGHLQMVTWLLENHAYIDAGSPNGTTPLMMAAREKRTTVARYLVEQGADPSLRNEAGMGAPEYFIRIGEPEQAQWMTERATEYLRKYGTQKTPVPAGDSTGTMR